MNSVNRLLLYWLLVATLPGGLVFSQPVEKPSQKVLDYIERYRGLAVEEMRRTGVPASITLAQGIYESGAGTSRLATEGNNHFGIKCKKEWTGQTLLHTDDRPRECFRKYATAEESYRDHSDFLRTRSHYGFLFLLDPLDYNGWAFGLKKAGYATSSTYPKSLLRLIEVYQLHQFDRLALPATVAPAVTTNK